MTEQEVKSSLKEFQRLNEVVENIVERIYQVLLTICDEFGVVPIFWCFNYYDPDKREYEQYEYIRDFPIDDFLNSKTFFVYVELNKRNSDASNFLENIPVEYIWKDDNDIIKDIQEFQRRKAEERSERSKKQKISKEQKALYNQKMKEAQERIKRELGIIPSENVQPTILITVLRNGKENVYDCQNCKSKGYDHDVIEVLGEPTDESWWCGPGFPSHFHECTCCKARSGPWVKEKHVRAGL